MAWYGRGLVVVVVVVVVVELVHATVLYRTS
jgi:hypothetical protein